MLEDSSFLYSDLHLLLPDPKHFPPDSDPDLSPRSTALSLKPDHPLDPNSLYHHFFSPSADIPLDLFNPDSLLFSSSSHSTASSTPSSSSSSAWSPTLLDHQPLPSIHSSSWPVIPDVSTKAICDAWSTSVNSSATSISPSSIYQSTPDLSRRDTVSSIATTTTSTADTYEPKRSLSDVPDFSIFLAEGPFAPKHDLTYFPADRHLQLNFHSESLPVSPHDIPHDIPHDLSHFQDHSSVSSASSSSSSSTSSSSVSTTSTPPAFEHMSIPLSTGIINVSVPHPELDDPNEPHIQQFPLPLPEMPRKHSQNRTYRCRHCLQLFTSSTDLKAHVLSLPDATLAQRPYKCADEACDWHVIGFHRNNDCTRHFRQVHGVREFVCRWQGVRDCRTHRFVTAWLRNRHERTVHAMELDKPDAEEEEAEAEMEKKMKKNAAKRKRKT
ncbi:hypothetical protein BZA70DRAFT_89051 [Myxozyma melibiosi]|uniref:C2H2-type domain-containing protein n=1 Tax=Myxozyma melibiosi TaxID=54550 RepID=A0ABR1EZE9_9ASCO